MAQRRPKISDKTETEVLLRSRRRCCLCFGLSFDTSYKRIQIAHLDENRENNNIDNLAALCQLHHDEYDSIPRQTKGLTVKEVKHHREQLYKALEQKSAQLILHLSGSGNLQEHNSQKKEKAAPSAELLGKVLTEYDILVDKRLNGGKINGISLAYLANIALHEHGDFDVATETLISLLRLEAMPNRRWPVFLWTHVPSATPAHFAVQLLFAIHKLDFWEFTFATYRLRDAISIHADGEEIATNTESPLIDPMFEPLSRIFYLCFRENSPQFEEWAEYRIMWSWISLIFHYALKLASENITLPVPPLHHWLEQEMNKIKNINAWFKDLREVPAELILIISCHRLIRLPDKYFQIFMNNKYEIKISDFKISNDAPSKQENLAALRQLALNATGATTIIKIKPEDEVDTKLECQRLVEELNEFGKGVVDNVKQLLVAEREIYMSLEHDDQVAVEMF